MFLSRSEPVSHFFTSNPSLQVVLISTPCVTWQQAGRDGGISKSKRVKEPAKAFAVRRWAEFPGLLTEQSHQSSEAHGKHVWPHVSLAEDWAAPPAAAAHPSDGTAESKTDVELTSKVAKLSNLVIVEAFFTDALRICWFTVGKYQHCRSGL